MAGLNVAAGVIVVVLIAALWCQYGTIQDQARQLGELSSGNRAQARTIAEMEAQRKRTDEALTALTKAQQGRADELQALRRKIAQMAKDSKPDADWLDAVVPDGVRGVLQDGGGDAGGGDQVDASGGADDPRPVTELRWRD